MFNEFMAKTFLDTFINRLANSRFDAEIVEILKDLHKKWSSITGIEDSGIFIAALLNGMKDGFAYARPSIVAEVAIRATSDGGFTVERTMNGESSVYDVHASTSGNRFIVIEE